MSVFFDRLTLCSTAALDCQTGQNKVRFCEKELSFLLVLLSAANFKFLANKFGFKMRELYLMW